MGDFRLAFIFLLNVLLKNFLRYKHGAHPPLAGGSRLPLQARGGVIEDDPSPAKTKDLLKQTQVFASSPARGEEHRSVGVLDFQDAGLGPIAYDISSLCEVVRRDNGDKMLDEMIAYYHAQAKPALSIGDLTRACHILSAQRHMRILGIIARLAQNGRKDKLDYVPRIWNYLNHLSQNDALKPVKKWMEKLSPE
jgi:hypothetical protein